MITIFLATEYVIVGFYLGGNWKDAFAWYKRGIIFVGKYTFILIEFSKNFLVFMYCSLLLFRTIHLLVFHCCNEVGKTHKPEMDLCNCSTVDF